MLDLWHKMPERRGWMKEFIPFPEYRVKSREVEWWLGPLSQRVEVGVSPVIKIAAIIFIYMFIFMVVPLAFINR